MKPNAKPLIALYDVHEDDQVVYRQLLGQEFELIMVEAGLGADTASQAAEASVLSVHVSSNVTAEIMQQMPHLEHVACRSTGYDNVDLAYVREHGITVSAVPAYGEATVAEYAMLLTLAISRRLMLAAHSVHAGDIKTEKLTGHDLNGKMFGIIGTGRIGRHIAGIAKGFGMTVLAYDPFPNTASAAEIGYEYVTLNDLLARADYISLHAPATDETHHILDAAAFAKVKHGVTVINTARGSLIDTPALIAALQDGTVGAAALDVLEGEEYLDVAVELHLLGQHKIDAQAREILGIDILSRMPNVLITSHNAFNTTEALQRIRETTVSNIQSWHQGAPQNLVK